MAYGRVIEMSNYVFKTPNAGVLMDLETGVKYSFQRPESSVTGSYAWNVNLYDIVSYTADGTTATEVTLYKKHNDGTVYSYSS
jgi:hypothetical protein